MRVSEENKGMLDIDVEAKIEGQVDSPLVNYYGVVSVGRIDGKPYMLLEDYGSLGGVEISEALYAEFVKQFKGTPDGVP